MWTRRVSLRLRVRLLMTTDLPIKHEHDASGCLDCTCNASPWSNYRGCTCPPDLRPSLTAGETPSDRYASVPEPWAESSNDFRQTFPECGGCYFQLPPDQVFGSAQQPPYGYCPDCDIFTTWPLSMKGQRGA